MSFDEESKDKEVKKLIKDDPILADLVEEELEDSLSDGALEESKAEPKGEPKEEAKATSAKEAGETPADAATEAPAPAEEVREEPAKEAGGALIETPEDEIEQEIEEEIGAYGIPAKKTKGEAVREWISMHKVLTAVLSVLLILLLVGGVGYGYFHSKYMLLDYTEGEFENDESDLSAADIEEDKKSADNFAENNQDVEEATAVAATGEIFSDSDVYNILLIGSDDRTKDFSTNARGDTCILLSINKRTKQVHLVSFERAMGVPILEGEYKGQYDWLTHTFRYGGPHLMTREIRECFKIDVTKYIRVNIWTFIQLVDSVGGVDIDMTAAEANNINHPEGTFTEGNIKGMHVEDVVQQDLVEGVNHLNGATAMCYARLRSIDSDWNRVQRQRRVILAAVEEMKKLSVSELDTLLNNVLPMVQTNLTESDIANLITLVPEYLGADFSDMTIPFKNTYGMMTGMGGRRMFAVDFDTNSKILKAVLYDGEDAEELEEYYASLDTPTYYSSEEYQEMKEKAAQSVGANTVTTDAAAAGESTVMPSEDQLVTDPNTGLKYDPSTGIVYDTTTGSAVGLTPDAQSAADAAAASSAAAETSDTGAGATPAAEGSTAVTVPSGDAAGQDATAAGTGAAAGTATGAGAGAQAGTAVTNGTGQ